MSRSLLHITKLEEFKSWLDSRGIEHRPPRGDYQVLQVKMRKHGYACVYSRHDMKEHFTVDARIEGLVSRFCRERKKQGGAL